MKLATTKSSTLMTMTNPGEHLFYSAFKDET